MASKIFFTALIFVLTAFIAISAVDPKLTGSELPFDIGDTLPDSVLLDEGDNFWFTTDILLGCIHSKLSGYEIDGIRYYYGVLGYCNKAVKPRVIHTIVVADSMFATTEGLKVGQSFADALFYSDGEYVNMGVAERVYVILPSGWNAAYNTGFSAYNQNESDTIPIKQRIIEYFFRSLYYSEYEKDYIDTIEGF